MNSVLRRFHATGLLYLASKMSGGPVEQAMYEKLVTSLKPTHLQLLNESYMHNVPKDSETHFKVIIVSSQFEGKPQIQRHQAVYSVLADELKSGVHALSILAKTPEQWERSSKQVEPSPNCRGGFGR